jgi:hypothetical protein
MLTLTSVQFGDQDEGDSRADANSIERQEDGDYYCAKLTLIKKVITHQEARGGYPKG